MFKLLLIQLLTDRWWQLRYFWNFHPFHPWGDDPNLTCAYFSNALVQPPTSLVTTCDTWEPHPPSGRWKQATKGDWVFCDFCGLQKTEVFMWCFPKIVGFLPKSSILVGFSMIFNPFWGKTRHFRKHPYGPV